MDSDPVEVCATGTDNLLSDRDMMDAATALLSFENGSFASVNYSWALPKTSPTKLDARMEVVGTKGSAYIGAPHGQGVLMATEGGISTPDLHHNPELRGKVVGDLREEIMEFVNSVLSDQMPPITGQDAFASIAQANAIIKSLAENRSVNFGDS